jgi:hypothetical protein
MLFEGNAPLQGFSRFGIFIGLVVVVFIRVKLPATTRIFFMSTATEDYIANLEAEIAQLTYQLALDRHVSAPTVEEVIQSLWIEFTPDAK